MRAASEEFGWNLAYGNIALMWRAAAALFVRPFWTTSKRRLKKIQPCSTCCLIRFSRNKCKMRLMRGGGWWERPSGIPVPAMSSALAFYDGYRRERLPANLLQAQRDYFGAHTYERVDKPRGEFFHTNWTGSGGDVTSTTYNG